MDRADPDRDRMPMVVRFAQAARDLGAVARDEKIEVPAFRAPPREGLVERSVTRYPGGAVVSVRLVTRPWKDVAVDMVDGVLEVNRDRELPEGLRARLLEAVGL